MSRDHAQLICDISELSDLFSDTASLDLFLQKIVEMVSNHMSSDVCSIYLFYEDTQELILKATKGLTLSATEDVILKLGEGLTGMALKELRPICERQASSSRNFKHFPGIGEELYESFLAVPILRGQSRIGVMVLQNRKKDYFTDQDIKIFKAVTSQLANTIETAKLFMSFHRAQKSQEDRQTTKPLKLVKGKVGAEGFAYGEIMILDREGWQSSREDKSLQKKYSFADFQKAVQLTERQLEDLQRQIEEKLSDVASLIFTAQILMLKDQEFLDAMEGLIRQGVNPPEAIEKVIKSYIKKFEGVSHAYIREKSQDVKDIGKRILDNLMKPPGEFDDLKNRVVIAEELFPSDALKLSSQGIKGIILLSGGVSSHFSILARSLRIPVIIVDTPQLLDLPARTKVFLDAEEGSIFINPSKQVLQSFEDKETESHKAHRLKDSIFAETLSKDGTRIKLLSNINLLGDLKTAQAVKAEGVGLYRTEFPFIVRSDFPSEEEQLVIYKKLVDQMQDKEIIFRTLDIGGDKVLSYYHHAKEENPFLGMRSIRFSLEHKDIFAQQIRAILRAGPKAQMKILFPMISSLDEFLEAKKVVRNCMRTLENEKVAYNANIKIGLMIELPAVLEIIEELAQEVDFFSIGTNDFVQYMLAVDRTNEKVADFYLPHHPAILRALKRVTEAVLHYKKDISICGDMAHDVRYLPYFLGIGIRKLSLDPAHLPKIQQAISRIDLSEAQQQTQAVLSHAKIRDMAKLFYRPSYD